MMNGYPGVGPFSQEPSPQLLAQRMKEAVESIAMEEKAAYLEALQRAPHLVATESRNDKFFRYCEGDVWGMAQRICLYWKERKQVFQERAFLPLDLTGRGALTNTEILCLSGGILSVLPPTATGQQVALIDPRQATSTFTAIVSQRCLFYFYKKLAENPRAQTEGVLFLWMLALPKLWSFDRDRAAKVKRMCFLTAHVLPVKVKCRIICQLTKSANHYTVQGVIAKGVRTVTSHVPFESILEIHIEQDPEKLSQQLLDAGLSREGIPDSIGGTWNIMKALEWCQAEVHRERNAQWIRDMGRWQMKRESTREPKDQDPSQSVAAAATPAAAIASEGEAELPNTNHQATLQNEQERKAANAIYSRRKRQRRKQEEILLQHEHEQAQLENVKLKAEQQRLQMLLQLAESAISHGQLQRQDQRGDTSDLHQNPCNSTMASQFSQQTFNATASQQYRIARNFVDSSGDDESILTGIHSIAEYNSGILDLDDQSVNSSHWPIMSTLH